MNTSKLFSCMQTTILNFLLFCFEMIYIFHYLFNKLIKYKLSPLSDGIYGIDIKYINLLLIAGWNIVHCHIIPLSHWKTVRLSQWDTVTLSLSVSHIFCGVNMQPVVTLHYLEQLPQLIIHQCAKVKTMYFSIQCSHLRIPAIF